MGDLSVMKVYNRPINRKIINYISSTFMILIFSLGGLTVFNFIIGLTKFSKYQTIISTCIFFVLDVLLLLYFLNANEKNKKRWDSLLIGLLLINLVYISPDFIYLNGKNIIIYILLFSPFSLIGMALIQSKDKKIVFFEWGEKLTSIIVCIALIYIFLLIIYSHFSKKIFYIEGLTYGDIALFFIPFYIILTLNLSTQIVGNKKSTIRYLKIIILTIAICFTGLRTGMLIVIFAPILSNVFLLQRNAVRKKQLLFQIAKTTSIVIIITVIGIYAIPSSSRLTAIKDNPTYDISENNEDVDKKLDVDKISNEELKNILSNDYDNTPNLPIIDLEKKEITTLHKYLNNKIFHNYYSEKQTLHEFRNEVMLKHSNKIIIAEDNKSFAKKYTIPRNRYFLWSAALNEWSKNKMFGNGVLHFQEKYKATFPHNALLESLSDFGLILTSLTVLLFLFLIIRYIITERNADNNLNLKVLVFALSYLPAIFLFTSLYRNPFILFLITILFTHYIKEQSTR